MSKEKLHQHEDGKKSRLEHIRQFYVTNGRLLKADALYLLEMAEKGVAAEKQDETNIPDLPKYPEKDVLKDFTNKHVITLAYSVGIMLLMILEKNLEPHAFLARTGKVKDVKDSLFALAKGLGAPLSPEEIKYWSNVWTKTWNVCMERIKHEVEGD